MRRFVSVDGREGQLRLEANGESCRFAYTRDGAELEQQASIVECEPGIFSILIDGRSYEAKVVPDGEGFYVDLAGHRSRIEVRDPRAMTRRASTGVGEGKQSVTAPMPGKVVRILVVEGDFVEAGAGIVVVEAMKMQNEMKAPRAGTVAQVLVREGDTVGAGDTLAVIE